MKTTILVRAAFSLVAAAALSSCFDSGDSIAEEDAEEIAYRAEKAERDKIKARVAELKAEKKKLETSIKELKSASGQEEELAKTEVEVLSDLEETRGYVAKLDALSAEVDGSLAAWREATRTSFKGVQLPEITTIDGQKYQSVTLNGVTDETIIIEHAGGMETIPILQLPVGLRKNVIHEPTVLADRTL